MRSARKFVDTDALVHNYRYLKALDSRTRMLAVVKADAYGHGIVRVARALSATGTDGFAVAVIAEGLELRDAGIDQPVLVMQGPAGSGDLDIASARDLMLVVHSPEQLAVVEQSGVEDLSLWVKFNTGMNRLGFPVTDAKAVLARIKRLRSLSHPPVLMSHFAYADDPDQADKDEAQWRLFESLRVDTGLAASIANSSGTLCRPQSRLDWARLGIAMYGAPPAHSPAEHRQNLRPVMRLTALVVAVRRCRAGSGIGYGGTYICPRDMQVAIVGIGYGDGYPRHARNGTPVWLAGCRGRLVGRVSMDMAAVALDDGARVAVGDVAELWGPHLPVSEVAAHCGTIAYELLCAARGLK